MENYNVIYKIGMVIIALVLFYISTNAMDKSEIEREKIMGLWLSQNLSKDWLFFYLKKPIAKISVLRYKSFMRMRYKYFMRLINMKTGKIEHEFSLSLKAYDKIELLFYTQSSLWLQINDGFICLELPFLKVKYNQKEFYKLLKKDHQKMDKRSSVKWKNPYFIVENTYSETLNISPLEFEKSADNSNLIDKIFSFNNDFQMGNAVNYSIPDMSLEQNLILDMGYDENFAVFTPDGVCLLLEGNKRLVMKKLISEKPKLKWLTLLNDKVWLKAEFLRPYIEYQALPSKRMVIAKGKMIFLFYHSSLDEEENKCHLSAINYNKNKVVWDTELSKLKNISKYRPIQNYIYKNIVITFWESVLSSQLTGIDLSNGKIIWKMTR